MLRSIAQTSMLPYVKEADLAQKLSTPGAGFMNRRRLCQLTAVILTSNSTTHMWVL